MSTADTYDPQSGSAPHASEMIVSREQLQVETEWIATGRCRLRRQVITETHQVQVTVHREVLVVDGIDLGSDGQHFFGTAPDGPVTAPPDALEPLVIVLRQQVPEIVLHTTPYEQVTARVVQVTGDHTVAARLQREQVDLDVVDSPYPMNR